MQVEYLPGDRHADPLWLWWSGADVTPCDVDRMWQTDLRRFDLEHTFRLFKQTLGWTRPKLRLPEAADRWTWLVIAAHTQLRLARPMAVDLRRPWEKPLPTNRLTPARVRRGFRNLRPSIVRLSHSFRSQTVKSILFSATTIHFGHTVGSWDSTS